MASEPAGRTHRLGATGRQEADQLGKDGDCQQRICVYEQIPPGWCRAWLGLDQQPAEKEWEEVAAVLWFRGRQQVM